MDAAALASQRMVDAAFAADKTVQQCFFLVRTLFCWPLFCSFGSNSKKIKLPLAPTPTIFVLYATPKKVTFLLGWPYEKVTFGQTPELCVPKVTFSHIELIPKVTLFESPFQASNPTPLKASRPTN